MLAVMLDEDDDDDFVVFLMVVMVSYVPASAWRRFDCRMPCF